MNAERITIRHAFCVVPVCSFGQNITSHVIIHIYYGQSFSGRLSATDSCQQMRLKKLVELCILKFLLGKMRY